MHFYWHTLYMCHICAKDFLDLNFDKRFIDTTSIFHEMAQNFTYS